MDRTINCFSKRPEAVARLICFPWAGGGSIHYAHWGRLLNHSIEVYSVRLPGREVRGREPFFQNMSQILDEALGVLLPALKEKPFAIFGHSFGAMTSYAFAEYVKKVCNLEPVHMFLSGASAPYSETRLQAPRRSHLSDEEFLQWMMSLGGTPPEILANPEALKLFLPALRADLNVVENYRCSRPTTPFCHVQYHALMARRICHMTYKVRNAAMKDAFKAMTSGDFTVQMLPGAHFYLKETANEKFILDYITKHLETAEMDYL